jgi:molybdopterin/thiamine biosynthesis adenylyltransferase
VTLSTQCVEPYTREVGGVRVIDLASLERIAQEHGLARRETEAALLEMGILPRRYLRNWGTLGLDGQRALFRSCVAVIGLGGLGGYVVECLARLGVGRLVLVDGDVFLDHNLNRQVLSCEGNLGRAKAEVAAERVGAINPAVEVVAYAEYATRESLPGMLSGTDVVIDALDRLPTRLVLQDAAARLGVPMVHGAIAGMMGQVMTILPGDGGLRLLYGEGELPEQGAEAQLGTPAPTPMMIAALQVQEAVKLLTGQGELLRRRTMFVDGLCAEIRILRLDNGDRI